MIGEGNECVSQSTPAFVHGDRQKNEWICLL